MRVHSPPTLAEPPLKQLWESAQSGSHSSDRERLAKYEMSAFDPRYRQKLFSPGCASPPGQPIAIAREQAERAKAPANASRQFGWGRDYLPGIAIDWRKLVDFRAIVSRRPVILRRQNCHSERSEESKLSPSN